MAYADVYTCQAVLILGLWLLYRILVGLISLFDKCWPRWYSLTGTPQTLQSTKILFVILWDKNHLTSRLFEVTPFVDDL